MSSERKDEHLKLAFEQKKKENAFDRIFLLHDDLPELSVDQIDLSTSFLGHQVQYPFYINAMTGGSQKAYEINDFLSKIANHFGLPMVTGSQSIALKDSSKRNSFEVIRTNHKGILVGNINANSNLEDAKQAVEMVNADALSIHLNVIQELVMSEGDRDFRKWKTNIRAIIGGLDKPVLIKEVGFGLSRPTIDKLKSIGAKYIDVAGKGGTSFLEIESARNHHDYMYLNDFGLDTADTLIELKDEKDLEIYASGGIRHALDIVKALALGAKAVGLSKWFLELTNLSIENAIWNVNKLIEDIKKIMVIVGVSEIEALRQLKYVIK